MTLPWMRAQVAAGQVAATLQVLTMANLVRQAAGLGADQTAAQSHAETAAAFELLESGLGRPARLTRSRSVAPWVRKSGVV
jgi:hypothetical protein